MPLRPTISGGGEPLLPTRIATLQARLAEARYRRDTLAAEIRLLRMRLAREPQRTVTEEPKENPRIARLRERLEELETQHRQLLAVYSPSSRQVRNSEEEIHAVKADLADEPAELRVLVQRPGPANELIQQRLLRRELDLLTYEAEVQTASRELQRLTGRRPGVRSRRNER